AEAAATGARGERDRALAAMPLWPAGRDDVETAPVPVRETVARFAARESDLDAEQRAVKAELDRLAREVERRDAERRELARERAVPTEEALAAARMRRDQGWRLVRGAWLDEESEPDAWAIYDGEREPADAFEHAMRQADDAADRLRDDAERVARARSLDEDDARDAARRADALRREAEWRERRDAFEAAWAAVWEPTGVAPLSSAEMREWLDAFAALREKARAAREMSDAAERVRVEVSDAQKTLREALRKIGEKTAAGDGVSALIDRAKRIVEEEDRTARAREMLGVTIRDKEREVADLDARLETERARMTQWASDWRAAIATLPVPPDAEPAVASEVLRRLDEFFGKEIRIGDFDTRIVKMRALIEDVSRRADSLCKEAGVDLAGADAADTAMRLSGLLDQAGLDERTLSMLTAQEQRESEALDEARRGLSRVEAEIESLRERARVERADELEDVAVRAARKRARIARRDELRLDLAREAADGDAEALRADVAASTAALDETEWRRATDERARLRGLLDQTNREIGEAGADLRDTAHASKAGELLETRQFALARLRDAVETYRRLRLATHLLRARIESMRERAQNPTMALAGDIFAALTRGSFARLVGDYGGDVPRLQGVRADGDWVGVDGMSDGTRDQLWLALRLAWIELRAEDGLVLPVIADDLLVQFDEDRATAALEALARLSDRTQVLLFTHHRHTSELIRALGDDTRMRVFEHELGM
ncbi:MAG: hypothetical protein KJ042_15290, partial [Deltaproteobacteria bacterium]|nr:hypothetical protein [Deltaproteobacteria bacterium]